jgi:hypothetical protein
MSDADLRPSIRRLLFVADAAVAYVDELPRSVRAVIDAADEVYVVTPTLPGRLAWLADDVDGFRHVADERLDVVLGHLRSIGAHADGTAIRGSVNTVIADAIASFHPDHILIALRSSDHSNWQERRLIEHISGTTGSGRARRPGTRPTAQEDPSAAGGARGPLRLRARPGRRTDPGPHRLPRRGDRRALGRDRETAGPFRAGG